MCLLCVCAFMFTCVHTQIENLIHIGIIINNCRKWRSLNGKVNNRTKSSPYIHSTPPRLLPEVSFSETLLSIERLNKPSQKVGI